MQDLVVDWPWSDDQQGSGLFIGNCFWQRTLFINKSNTHNRSPWRFPIFPHVKIIQERTNERGFPGMCFRGISRYIRDVVDRHEDPEPSKDTPIIHRLILRSLRSC